MKLGLFKLKLFGLVMLCGLLLVACERPVPGSEDRPTPPVTLPTVDPQPQVQPTTPPETNTAPAENSGEQTTDPAPAPVEENAAESGATDEGAAAGGSGTAGEEAAGGETQTAPTTDTSSYIVQPNDTLFSIAEQYGLTVEELAAANNITDVNALSIGDTLTIPAPGTVTAGQQGGGAEQTTDPQPTGQEQVHIVQAGENLFRIGLRYGFTVSELATYNNLANPNSLAVGQEIRIPAR